MKAMRWYSVMLLALWLTGCGGGGGDDEPAPLVSALRLDSAAAVTQSVGPAGGTISTTAADGTRYTLTVPAKALRSATTITLSPIAAIADLPSGVSLAAGAHLTPEGQRFDAPVKLTIDLAAAPAATAVPFRYAGELQQRHLYPARTEGRSIEFEVVHFSGYGTLVGVLNGVLGYFPQPSERGDRALQELIEATLLGLEPTARDAMMASALQTWLDEFIKPEVAALVALAAYDLDAFVNGRVARLAAELRTFSVALRFALLEGSADAFTGVQNAFQLEAARAARRAIDLSNAGCSAFANQAALLIAPDALAWQQLSQQADAQVLDQSLERQAVLQALCVQPVFDPQDGVGFAGDIQPGQQGLLTVRAGYSINGAPARFDLPMFISSAGTANVTPSTLDGAQIDAGQSYARLFQWHGSTPSMRIDASACFADVLLQELCQQAVVNRGAAGVGVTRLESRGTVTVPVFGSGFCDPYFHHSPPGATAWSDTISCQSSADFGSASGTATLSFEETYAGTQLIGVTASSSSTATQQGDGGGSATGQYTLGFTVKTPTTLAINAQVSGNGYLQFFLLGPGVYIEDRDGGTVNQTVQLAAGRHDIIVRASADARGSGNATFTMSLAFGL